MGLNNYFSRRIGHKHQAIFTDRLVAKTFVGIALLCLSACARNQTLPVEVTRAFETAFTRDDLPACLALFTDDAQILPQQGAVVSGHAEIEQFLKSQMTPVVSFNTNTDMSLIRGDIAVEQGHFKVRNIRRGADIESGKYVHIWRKVHGEWKLYRMIFNTDVAPKGEVSTEAIVEDKS